MADFEHEVVRIALLAGEEGAVRELTFIDCDIKGPAVLLPMGCEFRHPHFQGDIEAIVWDQPTERTRVLGAVLVKRCKFHGCTFMNIGITGPPALLGEFRDAFESDNPIDRAH